MTDPAPLETIASGRHLRLVRRGRWEYAQRVQAHAIAVILAITADERLILVEQARIPVGARVIELPAGLVGDEQAGEPIVEAARRELIEETGYDAERVTVIGRGPSSAGLTDELVTMVRAEGLHRVATGGGVAGEDITVHEIALADLEAWLHAREAEGLLIDWKVWAGLWLVRGH
jgi:ADP-ribose pyrophosphatase